MVGWAANRYDDLRAAEDHLASSDRTAELVELLGLQSYTYSVSGAARGAAVIDRIERYLSHLGLDPVEAGILQPVAAGAGLSARRPDWIAAGSADAITSLRIAGRPEDLAAALLIGSWMMALGDTDVALERLDEALAIADGASAVATANSIRAYQANHLTVAGRLEEAKGVLADLFRRLADTPYDYARHNFYLVSAAAWIIDDPERSGGAMTAIRTASQQAGFPYGAALLVCEAVAAASVGDVDRTFELVDETREDADRSGHEPLPDLLLPAAFLAWRHGHTDLARRWLTAIRYAGRPTQSFPVTVMFRQLRHAIGLDQTSPLEQSMLEEVFQETLAWRQHGSLDG